MKNVDALSQPINPPALEPENLNSKGFNVWFDLLSLLLVFAAVYIGTFSSSVFLSTPDRILFFVLTIVGLGIGLFRSRWHVSQPKPQLRFLLLSYGLSVILILLGVSFSQPIFGSAGLSVVVAVWCWGRMRSETLSRNVSLGAASLLPFALEGLIERGYFEWLESLTLASTSLLADAIGQPHAPADGFIVFKLGTADHFTGIGVWDSAVTLLGVSIFCSYAFRRGLLAATIGVFFAATVWIACRSVAWLVLSSLSARNGTWYEWSPNIEFMVFAICAIWVVGLDQFLGEILKPIPFDRVVPENPLFVYVWNWICSLPRVIVRIPKENEIVLRWRHRLTQGGEASNFKTDCEWLQVELLGLFFNPMGIIGSSMDAAHSWRISRSWKLLAVSVPFMILMIVVYGSLGIALFERKDIQTSIYVTESQKLCSTKSLEIACHKRQESDFVKATGLPTVKLIGEDEMEASAAAQRYVELLCKRILEIEPNDQLANYRLALILSLRNQLDEANGIMRKLVDGKQGDFPKANAWIAKSLLIQKGAGKEISKKDLFNQLDAAYKGKEVDYRLLFLFGGLLLEQGDKEKAIEVTKQAVAIKPDSILELARLYATIGEESGKISAANQAEDYFAARINFPGEKETDRISVAEARVLANRIDKAAEVLSEGLRQKLGGKATARQLSEIQGMIYRRSIRELDDGKYEMDLGLLEAMAETDPENPTISSEIANLLRYKVRPTKKLMDTLKKQMALGVTSVPSLLMLGEEYFGILNFKEAERYWGLALAKDPNNFIVLNNMANCLIEISPSNAENALGLIVRADSLSPNNAEILDTWGRALMMADRPKEAVNKLERVLRLDQERVGTRRMLRSVYDSLGMKEMSEIQAKLIKAMEESVSKTESKLKPTQN